MANNDYFRYFEIISKHAHVFLDERLAKYGLNHFYRIYIKKITEEEGVSRDKIKNYTHVHPSNTTRASDYLAKNGYVIKKVNELDKRICNLYPTDKLKIVYKELVKAENEWIEIITKDLTETEKEAYFNLLNKSKDLSTQAIHGGKDEHN